MTQPTLSIPESRRKPIWKIIAAFGDQLALLIVIGTLAAAFQFKNPSFLSRSNISTIANEIPAIVFAAVGMTYVLIIGGIDLSVGSVLAFSGMTLGTLMLNSHYSFSVAALVALAIGAACGAFNGIVTVAWSIPSFIVTLAMLEIARGATHIMSSSQTAYIGSPAGKLADSMFLGLSLPIYIAVAVVIAAEFTLTRTIFGRYMIATGTNEEAVRLSGIATRPIKFTVFLLAGLLAAAGAVMDVSHAQSATPNAGTGLELDVIAAVVVGGTSLMGGRGSVISSFLGVILIKVLSSGLASLGTSDEKKRVITGCVILGAAILDHYRHRLSTRHR